MNYLKMAIGLSRKSYEAGEFPAGAVLVTKSGNVYKSGLSVGWYHGEMAVIDEAIKAEGAPLTGAVMYSSMQSCLMCSAKMYWAGIQEVHYVIPKSQVNASYAYEDDKNINEHTKDFFAKIKSISDTIHLDEAMQVYDDWVKKIESKT